MTARYPQYVVELVRRDRQHVSTWSGGRTTEVAIYPRGAAYGHGGFLWRISSASVDSVEAEFTFLPGIWRLIMVLEGDMTLEHERRHSVRLRPFQQDAFAGDWVTRSKGRARDFNIMLATGCAGWMQAATVQGQSTCAMQTGNDSECGEGGHVTVIVYAVDGSVVADFGIEEEYRVDIGDALLLTTDGHRAPCSVQLSSQGPDPVHVVLAAIRYDEVQR
ncbi:MAG TPA: HutD family protein [Clostridia bacterium]|nr:HutD family protein [Clostridia bacterium]